MFLLTHGPWKSDTSKVWLPSSSSRSSGHLFLIEPFSQLSFQLVSQLPRASWRCRRCILGWKSIPSHLTPALGASPQPFLRSSNGSLPPKALDMPLPCWEHTAFSSCGWLPSHLRISAPRLPVQRRLAWPLDLGASSIIDWSIPSERFPESVQMDQCLVDSFLCPQHHPQGASHTYCWKYWHTDLWPITLSLVDGVQEGRMAANFQGLQVTSPPSPPSNVLEAWSLIFMFFPTSKHQVMLQINAWDPGDLWNVKKIMHRIVPTRTAMRRRVILCPALVYQPLPRKNSQPT